MRPSFIVFALLLLILGISYTAKMNRILFLRMEVPRLEKKIQEEEAKQAQYELEWLIYSNPEKLLQLKEKPNYRHLAFPTKEQSVLLQGT